MWTGKLRKQYASFETFEAYSDVYNLSERLGFASAADAWKANPTIQGSTNPGDYKIVAPRGNETIQGKPIRVYDNSGETNDRYTVVYMDEPERQLNVFNCVGMNSRPFDPDGFCQHSSAMPGKHLGKRISFYSLPTDCQSAVMQDLQPVAIFEGFEICMTLEQAKSGSHQGQCDEDVKALCELPEIKQQLDRITNEQLQRELKGYGAWNEEELQDREANSSRIVWLACGNIVDERTR